MRYLTLVPLILGIIFCTGQLKPVKERRVDLTKTNGDKKADNINETNKLTKPGSQNKNNLDPYLNKWNAYSKMPFPNNAFALVGQDEFIYVAGGYSPSGYQNAFVRYDLKKNTWEVLPDLPEARAGLTLSITGKSLYAIGGVNQKGPSARVDIFDLEKKEWQTGPDMLSARFQHTATYFQNEIWIVGGLPERKKVEYFSFQERVWKKGPNLKYGRDSHCAVMINKDLYLLGGKNKTMLTEIARMNLSRKIWEYKFQLPIPRFGFFSVNYNDMFLILGGFKDITATSYHGDVFLLNLPLETTVALKSLPSGLANFGAYRYQNQIFVLGGRNYKGIQDTVWRMDID